jgi:hypothetical protein
MTIPELETAIEHLDAAIIGFDKDLDKISPGDPSYLQTLENRRVCEDVRNKHAQRLQAKRASVPTLAVQPA